MSPRRTNRVAEFLAVVVAYAAGVAAAFSPASPTGRPLVDALLLGLSVAAVTYAGASAPWWVTVVAAGVALAVGVDVVLVALAAVALGIGLWVGWRQRNMPEWRAVSVGISMNVLAWSELEGFFGLSSIIAIGVGAFVFVLGIRRRPKRIRRVAWATVGLVGAFAVLASVGFGLAAADSRSSLHFGQDAAEAAIDSLDDGAFDLAAEQFEAASASLRDAENSLSSPLVAAASVVPVVAQHRALAVDLSGAGADATEALAVALREIDQDATRIEGGAIDLEAVAALEEPFARVDAALDDLSLVVEASASPWLIPEASEEIDSLAEHLAENAPRLDNARDAIDLAPQLLGADEPRVYLVLFTTPAEARGLGGFPGNYAELTIDQGRIQMTAFGRVSDLEQQAQAIGARVTGPEGFLAQYGQFGFDKDSQGLVGEASFRNLTMTPNFPWVAEVAADLYSQITAREVDGVIVMDPLVLARLVSYTNGIELTTVPMFLGNDNTANFLLREQYAIAQDNTQRVDALDEAARKTFDALLAGGLPDPATLARDLGPLTEERRLLIWIRGETEQDLMQRVGLLGEIPAHDSADGWSFTVNNAGGNKIDSYLQRAATYESTTDPSTGETTGILRVDLTNSAPPNGLPPYVIGNSVGLPEGTNRMYVSFYSPLLLTRATRDGEPTEMSPGREANWNVYSQYVDIPPGATTSFELQFSGRLDRPEDLVTWTQPLALPLEDLG